MADIIARATGMVGDTAATIIITAGGADIIMAVGITIAAGIIIIEPPTQIGYASFRAIQNFYFIVLNS